MPNQEEQAEMQAAAMEHADDLIRQVEAGQAAMERLRDDANYPPARQMTATEVHQEAMRRVVADHDRVLTETQRNLRLRRYTIELVGRGFTAANAHIEAQRCLEDDNYRQMMQLPGATPAEGGTLTIEAILDAATLELLKNYPENASVRAMVQVKVAFGIPDTLLTYEEITKHVLENYKPQPVPVSNFFDTDVATQHVGFTRRGGPTLDVEIEHTRDELGRCTYTERTYGTQHLSIQLDRLIELASESDDLDDLHERVAQEIRVQVDSSDVEFNGNDDGPDYDGHEMTDSDNYSHQVSTARAAILRNTIALLQEHLDGEERERLGIND